jgi:hypothetical protein
MHRFCTNCGSPLPPTDPFCSGCGRATGAAAPAGGSTGRSARRRWMVAAVAAGAVLVAGAALVATRQDGSPTLAAAPARAVAPAAAAPTTTMTTAPPPTTTTAVADARTAWTAVLGVHPGATSSPVGPLTKSAVVAEGRTAFAYRIIDGAWQQRAALDLGIEADTSQPVRVADVTGDHEDDFIVTLAGADSAAGSVVSAAGGAWRLVPFVDRYQGSNQMDSAPDLRVDGSLLISTINDCDPYCAVGHLYTQPWSYDRLNGDFYPNTGPGTPGGSGE